MKILYRLLKLQFLLFSTIKAATILVPTDYFTIQEAINASSDGDSIAVAPGTYFENIDFLGKNIKVVGDDANSTFIDGSIGEGVTEFPNGGFENEMQGWTEYSINNNYHIDNTGNNIYNSDETFEAYEGQLALKMWGSLYQGDNNTSWIGRSLNWQEMGLESGATVTFNGVMMSHADDWIGQGENWAALAIYINNELPYYSETMESGDSQSEWLGRTVTVTLPDNLSSLWVGVEFYHASIDDHGSVYIDALNLESSMDIVYGSYGNVVKFQNGETREALLKNFTITNGHASGSWPDNQGGGIMMVNGSGPTLMYIDVINNFAENHGGGISAQDGCSPLIQNITVRDNHTNGNGGGIYLHNHCNAVIEYSDVSNNYAQNSGGGVYGRDESNVTITGSWINDNTADNQGGGLYIENARPFVFKDSNVNSNTGGGVHIQHGGGHKFSNIYIDDNYHFSGLSCYWTDGWQATGLKIFNNEIGISIDGDNPLITNSIIANNDGRGIQLWNTRPYFVNCVVAYNDGWSDGYPTEIRIAGNSTLHLENSIVWGENSGSPADIYDPNLENVDNNINRIKIGYSILRTNDIQMIQDNINLFANISNGDPLFVDTNSNQFEVLSGSPAIDNGNPNTLNNDTDGTRNDIGSEGGRGLFIFARGANPESYSRFNDQNYSTSQFDPFYMGFSGVGHSSRNYDFYIINNGNEDFIFNNWTTTDEQFQISYWDNDYSNEEINNLEYLPMTISGLSSSYINNERNIALNYSPTISGDASSIITLSFSIGDQSYNADLTLQGYGYDIPEDIINVPEDVPNIQFALEHADWYDTVKVATGIYQENIWLDSKEIYLVGDNENWPTIIHDPINGKHSVMELYSTHNTLIKNFIITGGEGSWIGGDNGPEGDNYVGGGIRITIWDWHDQYNDPHTPRLENLLIEGNSAGYGGGIFSNKSNPRINNCIIQDNTTGEYGGEYGDQGIKGGGMYFMHSGNEHWTEIRNTKIISNFAGSSGGVHFFQNGENVLFENVLIADNSSQWGAAGIHIATSAIDMINSTIANNHTENSTEPGGLYASNDGGATIVNTIFSENTPYDIGVFTNSEYTDVIHIANSVVNGGQGTIITNDVGTLIWGDVNIDQAADLNDDYSLLGYSVGIGEGSPEGILDDWSYTAPSIDINGSFRPNPEGTNPDIGAFESSLGMSQYRIEVDSVYYVHGDTAILSINNISVTPLSSIELRISGFQGILDFIEFIDDESTSLGSLGWMTFYNDTDTSFIIASAGSAPITTSGSLFKLKLAIPNTLESQFVPITITEFTGNEDYTDFNVIPGGVQSVWGPEIAFNVDLVSGSYPLEVNFSDESISGTFPIETWDWSFGNDSSSSDQNTSFTYLYPGEYDISFMIEDGFGLTDTFFYPSMIQVDTLFGDITFNTLVQSYDASIILKYLVDLHPLNSLQLEIGDVSLNDTLSTLDAYYILQYMVGLIDNLPYNPQESSGAYGDFVLDDAEAEPGMILNLPIRIENAQNMNGFNTTLVYDPLVLALDSLVFGDYLNGYLIEYNESQPGFIKIAATGNQPENSEGILAFASFEVLEGFNNETTISLENVTINENAILEVGSEMTVSYMLGIAGGAIPDRYALHQNYPNPFNPITKISYDLPENAQATIVVYDMMGKHVKTIMNQYQEAGYHSIRWNGTNSMGKTVSAGIYMYIIHAGKFHDTKKMILLK